MNGLTNIITKITEQNESQCQAVINSAKEKAQSIVDNAKKSADEYLKKQQEFLDIKNASEKSKAVSSAEFEYKRVMLSKKCELIDECMKESLASMCNAQDDVYFGYIKTLASKYALAGKGSVSFSKKDLDRLPDGFEKELCECAGDGKTLEISKEAIDTEGGFVISYPEMRVDCTFASLVEENADNIKDAVNKILFS